MSSSARALIVALALGVTASASAQEVGAGRLEIGVATGGGALFLAASGDTSKFGQYSVGATVTFNVSVRVGIEGDLGFAIGRRQDLTLDGTTLVNQKTPKILNYNGSLIYSPWGSNHRVFPYAAVGFGALTMFNAPETAALGLTETRTFLTGNIGGGVNWFFTRHLGLRGDYRFLVIRNDNDAPLLLGHGATRSAHRVYGALILTY